MAALANVILYYLKDNGDSPVNSLFLSQKLNTDHQQIVGAIKSLQSSGNVSMSIINVIASDYDYSWL